MSRHQRPTGDSFKSLNNESPTTLLIEMNGALLQTIPAFFNAYENLVQQFGIVGSKSDFKKLQGLPPIQFACQLCEVYGVKKPLEHVVDEYRKNIKEFFAENVSLVDGVQTFLDAFGNVFTIGVVSSFDKKLTERLLTASGIMEFIDEIVIAEELEFNATEIPNAYRHLLSQVGDNKKETIAIVFSDNAVNECVEADIETYRLTFQPRGEIGPIGNKHHCFLVENWEMMQKHLAQ